MYFPGNEHVPKRGIWCEMQTSATREHLAIFGIISEVFHGKLMVKSALIICVNEVTGLMYDVKAFQRWRVVVD